MAAVIFGVDDDDGSREAMARALARVGHEVHQFPAAEEALARVRAGDPVDAVVSDVKMPGMDGFALLREVRSLRPDLAFLLVTAYGEVQAAVVALTEDGADDYLTKPVEMQELRKRVQLHLERRVLQRENVDLRQRVDKLYGFENIIGHSAAMESLIERLRLVAPAPSTVLIVGESGTGKELIANALHANSKRANAPFIKINCAAIPKDLIESELFGYKKGAFTGADRDKRGLFEEADGGTIFLDEIAEIPVAVQAKLLRVLESREFRPLGAGESTSVEVRVLAATNRDLAERVRAGAFREDLLHRLNKVVIELPPLRERLEDIPLLVRHFLQAANKSFGKSVRGVSREVQKLFLKYGWPGNVRELANVLESAVLLCKKDFIDLANLPKYLRDFIPPEGAAAFAGRGQLSSLQDLEKDYIAYLLKVTKGNLRQTAKILAISRTTLYNKLAKYGIRD